MTPVATEFTEIGSLRAANDHVYFIGASPRHFPAIVKFSPISGEVSILTLSNTEDVRAYEGHLSAPQSIEFPTESGLTAFGLFYPPVNRDFVAPPAELPPLIVRAHGGPTSAFSSALDWSLQYWTSRGFAVLNVNYGGSTGYGRLYRERLRGRWGSSMSRIASMVPGTWPRADEWTQSAWRSVAAAPAAIPHYAR